MTHQIVRLMFLAGLAFATPDLVRVKRGYGSSGSGASAGSYASSSSSSSAGGVGGGQPGNGGYSGGGNAGGQGYNGGGSGGGGYSGGQVGASAISGSNAGSLSGSGGGGGGGGGYGRPVSYGADGINSIPNGGYSGGGGAYGNAGGGTYASSFPGGSYAGSGGVPNFGGAQGGFGAPGPFPFNLPAGCATGFQGGFGPDPYQIHQEIIKRIQEDSLRFGGGHGNGFSGPGSHHSSTSFRTADSKHWVATSRDPAANWPDSWLPHIVKTLGPKNHDTRTRGQGYPAQGGGNNVGAYASGSISPAGGSGGAGVYPSDGLNVRFGDTVPQGATVQSTSGNIPPPKGNFYGVATSSSSGSQTVDGKTTSFKKSKVTFNEDGKETTYEASSP